ncbi:hypothetical protein [Haloglycomyces albus]|uniref:hypothetical protein n=1 Tax=Haloglycomyces albus TaxID=526067 RepID=UPI00046CBD19|nr:hypothetical protein [Haloglycomyces albus]
MNVKQKIKGSIAVALGAAGVAVLPPTMAEAAYPDACSSGYICLHRYADHEGYKASYEGDVYAYADAVSWLDNSVSSWYNNGYSATYDGVVMQQFVTYNSGGMHVCAVRGDYENASTEFDNRASRHYWVTETRCESLDGWDGAN